MRAIATVNRGSSLPAPRFYGGSVLLVRTEVRPSPIHGLGLFALEPIPAGTVVWRFVPEFDCLIGIDQVVGVPDVVQEFFDKYVALDGGTYLLEADDSRFMNHSGSPNLVTGKGTEPMVASRDIAAGEELTCDYRVFDEPTRRYDHVF